jgi:antitoxin CptB
MDETAQTRLRRIRMRAWRRGMKEMDLILGPYADTEAAGLDPAELDLLERMMAENDQDLYLWITSGNAIPVIYQGLIARIATFARARHTPQPR